MNRVLLAIMVTLVLGAVIAGFAVVGGPEYARMEKNDRQRVQDLLAWGEHYRCTLDQENIAAEAVAQRDCGSTPIRDLKDDPVTGAPYRLIQPDDRRFEVCATFQTTVAAETSDFPGYALRQIWFDGQTGCAGYTRADPQSPWQPDYDVTR